MNAQISQAFRQLYLGKRTGVLVCEVGKVKRSVFFRSRCVVGTRSSLKEDRLGEIMIRHGRITRQQLEDASHFIKSGWKLGEILAELRIIEKDEIERFVRVQLLDIACSVFLGRPRRVAFSNLSEVEGVTETPLPVADILMEVARRTPRIQDHLKAFREDERPLRLSSDPLLRLQAINPTPEEAYVLSRIDGHQPPRAIFSLSSLPEEQTVRTLLGLTQAGIIEPDEPDPDVKRSAETESDEGPSGKAASIEGVRREIEQLFERFQHQDRWEVLGLERGAGSDCVRRAFHEKVRRYRPDKYHKITDPKFQEKLSYIFHRVSEAFATLSSQDPTPHDEKQGQKEARNEERKKTLGRASEGQMAPPARKEASPRSPGAFWPGEEGIPGKGLLDGDPALPACGRNCR